MPTLAVFSKKQDFTSSPVTIPATGSVQLFVKGNLGGGQVVFALKTLNDSTHEEYPELAFGTRAAKSVELVSGDSLTVIIKGCVSASVEIRQ